MVKRWTDEEEQRNTMLAMLDETRDWIESREIEERTGMRAWAVFEVGMDLLSDGHPVCVQHFEGTWLNYTASIGHVEFKLARSLRELVEARYVVDMQLAFPCRIRSGIEAAQERLAIDPLARCLCQ